MSETLVLSVGLDPLVLYSRETILRSAGYIVVSATSIREAFHLFRDGDFDLMILCPTFAVRDRERLTCLIRASGSRIPVAAISGAPGEQALFSDATLEENPTELIAGIRRLLARRFELAAIASSPAHDDRRAVAAPTASRVFSIENKIRQWEVRSDFRGREAS
jgi:CheY-like chemotaxis protein